MNELRARAQRLSFYAISSQWEDYGARDWVEPLIVAEETERHRRSLERRIKEARLGRFKSIVDFDWTWPAQIDRELIDGLLTLSFMPDATNVVLMGPNGVGKTMLAQNLAYQALLSGHSVRFTLASEMLNDLAAQDGANALKRCLRKYCLPSLLVIDEVGYLSYDSRYADLLFEVVTRRYQERSTILTTNLPFAEWQKVFPNAASVVTLIDRLVHRCEIIPIEGGSYRLKEAQERSTKRKRRPPGRPPKTDPGADA